jgi:photosystem II stability/assembly factor-like uncharacterized protein
MTMCISTNGVIAQHGAAAPTRLLVAALAGLRILERKGPDAPWALAGTALDGKHVSALMREPSKGGIFAGVHGGGVFFSADEGASWQERSAGISIDHVFSLAYANEAGGVVLYAGTEPASLFRSDDYGATWQERPAIARMPGTDKWRFPAPPHVAHTKSLTIDVRDAKTIFAAVEQGALLKSTDAGLTWRELAGFHKSDDFWYKDIHRVVQLPSKPDELYMTTGMGLYHSADSGESWTQLTDRLDFRIGYPDHLLVSPLDERVLFLSGSKFDPSTWRQSRYANGTVMKSRDGGTSWTIAERGLPAARRANIEAMCMASYPGGFSLFIGNTDGEVYCSEDGAESWTRIASGLTPISKGGHYRNVQDAPHVAHA